MRIAAGFSLAVIMLPSLAWAALVPLKPHGQVVEEVIGFLYTDVGDNGIVTMDGDPGGAPVPPYFYHYAIQHNDNLRSSTVGYPGFASISYPGYTASIIIDTWLGWWVYSGDELALQRAVDAADWLLDRRTPSIGVYANWVYSTQTDGVMGGGFDLDAVMSDKPGMFGLRLLRLYDILGDPRYLTGATEIAQTYVATQLGGGVEDDGRWPFRVRPADGFVRQDYTSHLIPAILLLESMEARTSGQGFGLAAQRAWAWLHANPMNPLSVSYQRWEGFYEDIGPESAGLGDHYGAEVTAQALIERDGVGDIEAAIAIRDWSTGVFFAPDGAQNGSGFYTAAILEWQAWMNSTYAATAQWGVLNLRLHAATAGTALNDPSWRTLGLEALHNLTYGQAPASSVPTDDGRMLTTIRELTQPTFGRETWYEQNFNTVLYLLEAFDLEPSLAPDDQDHVLGYDGAEPSRVSLMTGRVDTEWNGPATVRMKLALPPLAVLIDGAWTEPGDPRWSYDAPTQVLTVSHGGGRLIVDTMAITDAPSVLGRVTLDAAPNPFNPRTQIRWAFEGAEYVRLDVFDTRGRHIRSLAARAASTGTMVWDGHDDTGRAVASGSYRVVAVAGVRRATRTITLVR